MRNVIDLPFLKQVYYFVSELNGISKLTDFDKTIEFFRSLHSGEASEFDVKVNQINGNFGKKRVIVLKSIPTFSDSSSFLSWVMEALSD
ncbi:hypothetical protein [Acinetobacter defluvii]|uniref:hypothetical protein n=1 Tax=Acinetobacter defluvii TaxID=1871111 RepID=UPI003AF4ADBA